MQMLWMIFHLVHSFFEVNLSVRIKQHNFIALLAPHNFMMTGKLIIKTKSIRKLSNFNFHLTKTLYQNNNNLNNIGFFFTFFKGYRCNSYL